MSGFARYGSLALSLLVFAGCAKGPQGGVAAAVPDPTAATSRVRMGNTAALRSARHAFAALPDRGELIAYPGRVVRQDGAYTWHRTDLSETHALHAIADGYLRVTTPSGELLDFQYDAHVEHPSGDWTWVGHIAGHADEQAILTFGEHAAFGTIAQSGKPPLRLTVRDGTSWLVETDPRKVAAIVNAATRPQRPDFLVPPKVKLPGTGPRAAADSPVSMASTPVMAAATATTATTVDLVLGYTAGFASAKGGTSAAVTRLNYLVDVTNVAYTNSQINAKVRLVATVQVTYPDATSNDTALEQLTGYDSTSNTRTTPNAAFNALRAARDQYGADLVAMARSFRDPENGGCGVGWLIGGGQSGISSSDAYFGYSVVSDGTDVGTDGKTYYCLDETLAHELGHGMGAAHDVETSKGSNGVLDPDEYGVYPYSFGYKNVTRGFYTVMAYGDTGQQIYRTFSNPRTTFCGGTACGITDQADNARTLTQTIATVATFRATVVAQARPPVHNDVNRDGKSDLLFRKGPSLTSWLMSGSVVTAGAYLGDGGTGYAVVATGDFNGDGGADVAWANTTSIKIWINNGAGRYSASSAIGYGGGWIPFAAADVNKDGKSDLLFRKGSSLTSWLMSGSVVIAGAYLGDGGTGYAVVATGDFNGDGVADVAWANTTSIKIWINNGAGRYSASSAIGYGGGWAPFDPGQG